MNKSDDSSLTTKMESVRKALRAVTRCLKALCTAFLRITELLVRLVHAISDAVRSEQLRKAGRYNRAVRTPRMRVTNATASTHARRVWKPMPHSR